jgi:hypothetical protein
MTQPYQPQQSPQQPPARPRPVVNGARLWGGGVATALVAALVALVGRLICENVLDITLATPSALLGRSATGGLSYPVVAFVLALLATGLAHLLALFAPQPRKFFSWIVGLCTLAGVALPFGLDIARDRQVATALVNLLLGLAIGSLLSAVLASSYRPAPAPAVPPARA